jgi:hypothetical protein
VTAFSGWYVCAEFVRWISDDFPGFVECRFADASGREWSVIEKVPVLTDAPLRSDSEFPQPAFIACEIVSRGRDDAGRETAIVSTGAPWAIEATDGTTSFEVFAQQLTRSNSIG